MRYALAIHKEPNSDYGVTVPDVPGCFSAGDTLEEAIEQAQEAIYAHMETLLELKEALPASPQPLEVHQRNPEFEGAVWALVDIDLSQLDPTPERVNVSIPRFALAAIDRYAKSTGKTRSGLLTEAGLDYIAKYR